MLPWEDRKPQVLADIKVFELGRHVGFYNREGVGHPRKDDEKIAVAAQGIAAVPHLRGGYGAAKLRTDREPLVLKLRPLVGLAFLCCSSPSRKSAARRWVR